MNNNRRYLLALICVSVLIITIGAVTIASSGLASAKYKKQQAIQSSVPVTVTVSADLAQDLVIKEHGLSVGDYGTYSNTSSETTANTYVLMPGVDIPKDPYIVVTGKTEIPAYLYVEVVPSNMPSEIFGYSLSSDWTEITSSVTPLHTGGRVFVYKAPLQKTATDSTPYNITIENILVGNKITVSQNLDVSSDHSETSLNFYAYMVQKVDGKRQEELFGQLH